MNNAISNNGCAKTINQSRQRPTHLRIRVWGSGQRKPKFADKTKKYMKLRSIHGVFLFDSMVEIQFLVARILPLNTLTEFKPLIGWVVFRQIFLLEVSMY